MGCADDHVPDVYHSFNCRHSVSLSPSTRTRVLMTSTPWLRAGKLVVSLASSLLHRGAKEAACKLFLKLSSVENYPTPRPANKEKVKRDQGISTMKGERINKRFKCSLSF